MTPDSLTRTAREAIRELEAHARPPGAFDATRYFRTSEPLTFLNTGTPFVRALGKEIARAHKADWSVREFVEFADLLIKDPRFEVKGVGLEALATRRRELVPDMLPTFKRWLVQNHCANWATTDSLCGAILGPLLLAHPDLVSVVSAWSVHRNLWVRRAAAVSLIKSAARGQSLDAAYGVVSALRPDEHDLIHKAAGWLLREAGKTDGARLERYLRDGGSSIPRTTLRYAIERFAPAARHELLRVTRASPDGPKPATAARRRSAPR